MKDCFAWRENNEASRQGETVSVSKLYHFLLFSICENVLACSSNISLSFSLPLICNVKKHIWHHLHNHLMGEEGEENIEGRRREEGLGRRKEKRQIEWYFGSGVFSMTPLLSLLSSPPGRKEEEEAIIPLCVTFLIMVKILLCLFIHSMHAHGMTCLYCLTSIPHVSLPHMPVT